MNYSPYQTAIFDAVKNTVRSIIVNAVAGSGKTTTIVEMMRFLTNGRVAFVAFNNHVAKELKERLGNVSNAVVSTSHAMGLAAIRLSISRVQVMGGGRNKWGKPQPCKILDYILANNPLFDNPQGYANRKAVKRLLSIIRNTLANYRDGECLNLLMAQYDIRFLKVASAEDDAKVDITDKLLANIPAWMDECISMGMRGMIDFDDMLYLPAIGKFDCPKYDVLLIDEVQDYNAAQIALTKASVKEGGRIIAVGDRRQAIYGFRGATANAFDILKDMFGAMELPLSISYRCPKSHVAQAQTIVPEIEHAESAVDGEIVSYGSDKLVESLPDDALVLARRNAPLVPYALKLIKAGRKAIVKGKSVADNLAWLIKNMNAVSVSDLMEKTEAWKVGELAKWSKKPDIQDTIIDKAEIILALCESCPTVEDVLQRLDSLFSDDSKAAITFSTVHRAKGLEAEYVAIVEPDKLAKANATVEELNVTYVAYTRSKRTLALVTK